MPMSCEEFQGQLPALIESGADPARHPHTLSCDLCRALIEDLKRIAEESRFRRFDEDQ
jgi:hypothetical protein